MLTKCLPRRRALTKALNGELRAQRESLQQVGVRGAESGQSRHRAPRAASHNHSISPSSSVPLLSHSSSGVHRSAAVPSALHEAIGSDVVAPIVTTTADPAVGCASPVVSGPALHGVLQNRQCQCVGFALIRRMQLEEARLESWRPSPVRCHAVVVAPGALTCRGCDRPAG